VGKDAISVEMPRRRTKTSSTLDGLSLLLARSPRAKLVHLVCDGRAVAANHLVHGRFGGSILSAAEAWCAGIRAGLLATENHGANRVLRMRFEEIVRNPQSFYRQCRAFLRHPGRPPALRDYTALPTPAATSTWADLLTPRQIELFEHSAGRDLKLLGYPLLYGGYTLPASPLERLTMTVGSVLRCRKRSRV